MLDRFPVFGDVFSQCFTVDFVGPEILTVAESEIVGKASDQRKRHFSTGRLCAKKALEGLGFLDIEILRGVDKEPLWPNGVVGSISHSSKLAGAVVAKSDTLVSVGLDIEMIGGVSAEMWDVLFNEQEQKILNSLDKIQPDLFTTLFFSIKESFYKFQHPLTKLFLDFKDVEIHYHDGKFTLSADKLKNYGAVSLDLLKIQWAVFNDHVVSICWQEVYHR